MCIVSRSMMWSLLLLSLCLIACDHKEKPTVLPHSKGLPSEVLLVTDDAVGQSDVMDSLNALTQQCLPEIMQPETMFRVLRVSQRNYTQRYITMHTKLFVNIDKSLSAPMMGISRDVEATRSDRLGTQSERASPVPLAPSAAGDRCIARRTTAGQDD